MQKATLFNTFQRIWPQFVLVLISLIIAGIHFKSGLWLTGWDNLHPEYNFSLNITRSLSSVWQEYQGLGLLAGMAHASDLPRQIFLFLLSLFVSTNQLRFVWTFLMLGLGPLGIYSLIKKLVTQDTASNYKQIAGFLGSLFYLLNLGTVQFFYLPFETFTAFYGFLPWLLYLIVSYVQKPNRKTLTTFFVVSFLTSPAWYVPTLFVVYLMALTVFFLGLWFGKKSGQIIKQWFIILSLVVVSNAFWLFPYSYFVISSSSIVGNAYQNHMGTEDIYLRNKEFGDLGNVAILKNFWFKFIDTDKQGNLEYMAQPWRDHFDNPIVQFCAYFIFILILIGLFSLFKKRNPCKWGISLLFFLPVIMLANNTWGFSQIVEFLQQALPIFKQIFRVPFTKFGILAALVYSLLFSLGSIFLIELISKKLSKKFNYILAILFSGLVLLACLPVFRGKLIYDLVQLNTPIEYFELIKFFQNQNPNTRIANLPQYDYWGWNHYRWNYVGSGFLWYGIQQPILDRAFDGFSSYNENYYWEISQAIYSKDLKHFESILEKYQIDWLVLDENIISSFDYKVLNTEVLIELIHKSNNIKEMLKLDKISVYQVNKNAPNSQYIYLQQNLKTIGPETRWNNNDVAFSQYGDYINNSQNADIYYPFRSLFTGRKQEEIEFDVYHTDNQIIFKSDLNLENIDKNKYILETPKLDEWVFNRQTNNTIPKIQLKDGKLKVIVDKIEGLNSYSAVQSLERFDKELKSCNEFNQSYYDRETVFEDDQKLLHFISESSNNCLSISLPEFSQKAAYLVILKSRHVTGKGMLFYVLSNTNQKRILETYLPLNDQINSSHFIIPPMAYDGLGYSLYFDNISIGQVPSINDLGDIEVYPIPYNFIKNIKLVKKDSFNKQTESIEDFEVNKKAVWLYELRFPTAVDSQFGDDTVIKLSQAYHKGWLAFYFDGMKPVFLPHVKVNNWANGWEINLEEGKVIYILFWPQVLEFVGFSLLVGTGVWLWRFKSKRLIS
jgi:hypothetical protein